MTCQNVVRRSHGTRRRSWLRYSAPSRKVAVSIPGGVIGNIHWHNTFSPTLTLGGDSASNRNEFQECFLESKGARCKGLTNLPHFCADFLEIWTSQPPGTRRVCAGMYRGCFNFISSSLWTQTAYTTHIGWSTPERQTLLFLGTISNKQMQVHSIGKTHNFWKLKRWYVYLRYSCYWMG
jgi:hypothetical protein